MRRRTVVVALVILALVLGSTTAISIAAPPDEQSSGSEGSVSTPMFEVLDAAVLERAHPTVAVVTMDNDADPKLQIVSSRDGSVVKEVGSTVDLNETQAIATSPDAAWIYISRGEAGSVALERVSVDNGTSEVMALEASQPTVNPNGTHLAYAMTTELVIRDLSSGTETAIAFSELPGPARNQFPAGTHALAWVDHDTVVALLGVPGREAHVVRFDVSGDEIQVVGEPVPAPSGQVIAARSEDEVVISQDMERAPTDVSLVDLRSGEVKTVAPIDANRTVFDVDRFGGMALVAGDDGLFVESLNGDEVVKISNQRVRSAAF